MKKSESLIKSFSYALCGIKSAFKMERNITYHFILMLLVIICGFILSISLIEWCICITLFGFVIAMELVNTSVENVVDTFTSEFHPKAKIAKDTVAGAVLISSIISASVGLMIFIPKIISFFDR